MFDASDYTIGVILGQNKRRMFHAIYYACKTLIDAQLNYATIEKELLAFVFVVDKFRAYLIGTKMIVYINHATIKYLISKKNASLD